METTSQSKSSKDDEGGYDMLTYRGHPKARVFITDDDEVFVAGLSKWFMWSALADGQPMGKFGKHTAFQIGTLAECDGAFYIVADNDDYFKSVPANMLRTINDRKSLKLGGYKRVR